nr:MAG TPA: hypothetical protein [Caudoviricetes sp.]
MILPEIPDSAVHWRHLRENYKLTCFRVLTFNLNQVKMQKTTIFARKNDRLYQSGNALFKEKNIRVAADK